MSAIGSIKVKVRLRLAVDVAAMNVFCIQSSEYFCIPLLCKGFSWKQDFF